MKPQPKKVKIAWSFLILISLIISSCSKKKDDATPSNDNCKATVSFTYNGKDYSFSGLALAGGLLSVKDSQNGNSFLSGFYAIGSNSAGNYLQPVSLSSSTAAPNEKNNQVGDNIIVTFTVADKDKVEATFESEDGTVTNGKISGCIYFYQ